MKTNAIVRYIWLIDLINRAGQKGLTYNEINEAWEEKTQGECSYPLRTFNNHRDDIDKIFGIEIKCNKSTHRYHINNRDVVNSTLTTRWIIDSYTVGVALSESQTLSNRIALEEIPCCQPYLIPLVQAIRDHHKIGFYYKKFSDEAEKEYLNMIPYGLKVFERRWYLMAKDAKHPKTKEPNLDNNIKAFSLDRIKKLEIMEEETFELPKDFDIHELFQGVYGIFREKDWWKKRELVKIKAYGVECNYLRSLPLHESQKEVETGKDYAVFEYFLTPAVDFKQKILSMRDTVEVLEPLSLREEIKDYISKMVKLYQ